MDSCIFIIDGKELYLDKTYITEEDTGLFFTCLADDKTYIALCINADMTYYVGETTANNLKLLLDGKLSVKRLFSNTTNKYIVHTGESSDKDKVETIKCFRRKYLPKNGLKYSVYDGSVKEYAEDVKAKYNINTEENNGE